jgi:hypothetical protein
MGTHNHLLRLGEEIFLEIIAVNPAMKPPLGPRWFGLDDAHAVRSAWDSGMRLRGWVASTGDIDAVLASHGRLLGLKTRVSRGDRSWLFSVPPDGSQPAAGVAPSVIDWGAAGSPARAMPDLGARLMTFVIEHPDPIEVAELYEKLDILDPPQMRAGMQARYRAEIETPRGIRELY